MNQIILSYYNHNVNVKPTHIRSGRVQYYDLTIVEKGSLFYVHNGKDIVLKPGELILFRPGECRQRFDSETVSNYISFNFTTDMDLSSVPVTMNNILNIETSLLIASCDNFRKSMPDHYLDEAAYILGALLLYIKGKISNSYVNPLALKIKNYILNNYSSQISLDSISRMFNFSASYCNTTFKNETNKSIIEFLIEERINKAKELLIHTALPVTKISSMVGYDDYNYFSRLFKKYTLKSPTQYRRMYSGE